MATASAVASGGGAALDDAAPDPLMQLSQAEMVHALNIRATVEQDPTLVNLTDFEYVQYALTNKEESMEQIRERVYLMQCFREEYKIRDTVEEGAEFLHQFSLMCPGVWLAVEYLPSTKNYLIVFDFAAFYPSRQIKTDENIRVYFGANYYQWNSLYPNFHAIREGWTVMCECEGTGFEAFDPSLIEKSFHHLFKAYPKNQKEVFMLNTPTAVNMWWSLWKKFLPADQRNRHHMGHRIEGLEGHRLDEFYKTPTEEASRVRMVQNVAKLLQIRQKNAEEFSLLEAAVSSLAPEQAAQLLGTQRT